MNLILKILNPWNGAEEFSSRDRFNPSFPKTNCFTDIYDSKELMRNLTKRTARPKLLKTMSVFPRKPDRWTEWRQLNAVAKATSPPDHVLELAGYRPAI